MEQIDVSSLEKQGGEAPVIRLVNLMMMSAIQKGASDIHIEPYERNSACGSASTAFSTASWRRR